MSMSMPMTFANRTEAGRLLAERFADLIDREDVIVLGLPRGGVPVAAEVSRAIMAPLDVLLVRKLGVPGRPELAMGAIASGNHQVLDDEIITSFDVTNDQLQRAIERETRLLHTREKLYRGSRPLPDLQGKIVVVIDDGLATGSTMKVAIQAVKQQLPTQIIVGVPVGSPDRVAMIGAMVDRIECVIAPPGFSSVGQWYRDFRATSDVEVIEALAHGQTRFDDQSRHRD